MAFTTTRLMRGVCWRAKPVIVRNAIRTLIAFTAAVSILQLIDVSTSLAQVTPPSKKVVHKAPAKPSTDNQADQLNAKWLSEFNKSGVADKATENGAPAADATAQPPAAAANSPPSAPTAAGSASQATAAQARAAASSINSTPPQSSPAAAPAATVPVQAPDAAAASSSGMPSSGTPSVAGTEDERTSSVPSMAILPGAATRSVVAGSVTMVKADNAAVAFNSMGGANQPLYRDLDKAFAGFAPNAGAKKVEMMRGRTADGSTHLLYASIGDGKDKQSYWWFSPPDQPDGWFDNSGRRLGGTMLSEPKPDSRISSPFGKRRYYGRTSGAGFHNGIDFEGKVGDAIYAAADGVINHAGWYYNYGRTVKISHADNFETLYAHMSRFATDIAPGVYIHKGEVIGYVGSTGRSTGPHLHFSTIVDGQFVDPEPYISENGGNSLLSSQALVTFRQWQGDLRAAALAQNNKKATVNVQGPDPWSHNPFVPPHTPGHH